ncbi:MAG: hypothetical protein VXW91_01735 [Pseudomonadota bacterium]|nr:hypothetical protein [Pseudomonadota bacterium]
MIAEAAGVVGAAICLSTLFNKRVGRGIKAVAGLGVISLVGTFAAAASLNNMQSEALGMVPVLLAGGALSSFASFFCLGAMAAAPKAKKNREDFSPRP